MSRRVPEFALVTGVFLGLAAFVSGVVLTGDVVATCLVAAAVSYPFVGFAIVRDDDPTTVLPPRVVLAFGCLFGAFVLAAALWETPTPQTALSGAFVGLLLAVPPGAYAVHFGADVNPFTPRQTVLAGLVAATLFLSAGLLADAAFYGAADGLLVGLSAAVYGTVRGVYFTVRARRAAVAVGVLVGVGLLALGVSRGEPLGDWVVVAMVVTFAPSLFYALTAGNVGSQKKRRRRSRR
jgi:hypothetical protein